ncbi:MAG: helix-turn-helix transcriptional regulator [Nocardiopsaceae bacterium]|nr:helix-turn-helix transcriptional regulator [Nocardiopsaceae bacterium]
MTEMRVWRKARGWSQADLARECKYSHSLIAMAETYERPPTMSLAKALDHAFQTPGYTPAKPPDPGTPGTFQRILHQIGRVAVPVAYRRFVEELQQRPVRTIYWSEHSYVPGILQTPGYARAVLEHTPNITEDTVTERLDERVAIQNLLTRADPPPPVLWIVMDEHILERTVGGPEVMREQCTYLVEIADRPNVTIQVISGAEEHPGLNGAFVIAEMATGECLAHVDSATLVQMIDDPDPIADLKLVFDTVRADAYRRSESLDILRKAVDKWNQ